MWPSNQESRSIKTNNNYYYCRAVSCSSSSYPTQPSSERRGVEEVWKDIPSHRAATIITSNPATLCTNTNTTTTTTPSSMRGLILQDFLALAFKGTPALGDDVPILTHPPLPPSMPQATAHIDCPATDHPNANISERSAYPDDGLASPPAGLFSLCPKKRALGFGVGDGGDSERQQRMIKNRESAARSRARKQAYTHELEVEIQHLVKENDKLKKQHEQQIRMAMAGQLRSKKKLQRCGSAPF